MKETDKKVLRMCELFRISVTLYGDLILILILILILTCFIFFYFVKFEDINEKLLIKP